MTPTWFTKMKTDLSREDPNYPSLKARYIAMWAAGILGLVIAIGSWFVTDMPLGARVAASFAGVFGVAVGLSLGLLLKRTINKKGKGK